MAIARQFFKATICVVAITWLFITNSFLNRYAVRVRVVDINDDIISVVDKEGNLWEFYGSGCDINDDLMVVFYNNNSSDITDDSIVGFNK